MTATTWRWRRRRSVRSGRWNRRSCAGRCGPCVEQLPDTYRTILVLRDLEELTTDEAASALGISTNAVKVRLHRARQALLTLMSHASTEMTEVRQAASY